ncbi:MAG: ATP12 family protein [Pseudomonadota bacterium]
MSEWKQKRFWKAAAATEIEGGWTITLDGRAVKTPAKAALVVPTEALALAIAAEWHQQEDTVDPLSMPFTRSANAAIDKVRVQHAEVADMLAGYGDSDLLCYRAAAPEELATRQSETWDPYLDWVATQYGARLSPRIGIMHAGQDPDALARLSQAVHALDDFELAAFHDLVSLSGSLVLGFAAAYDVAPTPEIWAASRVDEGWQEEQWGKDEEATQTAEIKKDAFLHAKTFFDAAKRG